MTESVLPALCWTPSVDITEQVGGLTSRAPALVNFNSVVYLFYQSDKNVDQYTSSFDGQMWSATSEFKTASSVTSFTGLSPVVFGGRLYLFYRPSDDHTGITYVSSSDGARWSEPRSIFDGIAGRTSMAPTPVVFGARLYVFFRGEHKHDHVYARSTADGVNWDGAVDLVKETGIKIKSVPVPIGFAGRLWVFCRTSEHDGHGVAVASMNTQGGWSKTDLTKISGIRTSADPATVVYGNELYAFLVGKSKDGNLYTCKTGADGAWQKATAVPHSTKAHTTDTPTPIVHDGNLYVFFRGRSDRQHVNVFLLNSPSEYVRLSGKNLPDVASADGSIQAVATDNRLIVAYRSKQHHERGLTSFGMPVEQNWGGRVQDAMRAFEGVPKTGTRDRFHVSTYVDGSVRPFSVYRDWILCTSDENPAHLYVIDQSSRVPVQVHELAQGPYTSCVGAQVIGDFLVVALNSATGSRISCYDLGPVTAMGAPTLLPANIEFPEPLDGVGITDAQSGVKRHYVLGAYARGRLFAFRSNPGPLSDVTFTPSFFCSIGAPADTAHLLTDQYGDLFLLTLGTPDADRASLFALHPSEVRARMLAQRVFTPTQDSFPHFKFGAGTCLVTPTTMALYATAPGIGQYLSYDVFEAPRRESQQAELGTYLDAAIREAGAHPVGG
ncbi:glycoside hydrolase [Actinokineospora pegani]|uniref:glycoside hydrolase n=1 Tax=Actinokineospora pegani TaxID=2654637 RepID=UPI0012E9B92A|nr:glycoside hydrolase [Actinokineospora pegani]